MTAGLSEPARAATSSSGRARRFHSPHGSFCARVSGRPSGIQFYCQIEPIRGVSRGGQEGSRGGQEGSRGGSGGLQRRSEASRGGQGAPGEARGAPEEVRGSEASRGGQGIRGLQRRSGGLQRRSGGQGPLKLKPSVHAIGASAVSLPHQNEVVHHVCCSSSPSLCAPGGCCCTSPCPCCPCRAPSLCSPGRCRRRDHHGLSGGPPPSTPQERHTRGLYQSPTPAHLSV